MSTGNSDRGRMESDFDIDVRPNNKIINSLMEVNEDGTMRLSAGFGNQYQ